MRFLQNKFYWIIHCNHFCSSASFKHSEDSTNIQSQTGKRGKECSKQSFTPLGKRGTKVLQTIVASLYPCPPPHTLFGQCQYENFAQHIVFEQLVTTQVTLICEIIFIASLYVVQKIIFLTDYSFAEDTVVEVKLLKILLITVDLSVLLSSLLCTNLELLFSQSCTSCDWWRTGTWGRQTPAPYCWSLIRQCCWGRRSWSCSCCTQNNGSCCWSSRGEVASSTPCTASYSWSSWAGCPSPGAR